METGIISIPLEQWLQVAKLSMVKFIISPHLVSGFNIGGDTNEAFEKMMQVALATFFFGLLATNTVFADTTGGQFVDKDNRKYYVKDDHKAIYWHKIDGKTYYFGDKGEMVVGWQYLEIPGTGYRDDLLDNQPVNEIGLNTSGTILDKMVYYKNLLAGKH